MEKYSIPVYFERWGTMEIDRERAQVWWDIYVSTVQSTRIEICDIS